MLSGAGAEQFASEQGLERVENSFFFNTEHRYQQLERALEQLREQEENRGSHRLSVELGSKLNMGTVGGGLRLIVRVI